MDEKKRWMISIAAGIFFILTGLTLDAAGIGSAGYLGFASVGGWMIYAGLVSLAIGGLRSISKAKLVDERMMHVGAKANRITFVGIILAAFAVMIADGISPIQLPYSMFMSYFICGIILVNLVSYRILLRYN